MKRCEIWKAELPVMYNAVLASALVVQLGIVA